MTPTVTTGRATAREAWTRRVTTGSRWVAAALTLVMAVYFVTSDAIRAGNPFLLPDAVLTLLLAGATVVRGRLAAPAMIFAFAWAAAVWTVSLCTYATRGAFAEGANHIALIVPCVAAAAALAITGWPSPAGPDSARRP
ncbi:hypothetical protein JOL79_01910 [Microbispora sp. RL4-1S]|uniref:Uncharacterized protein n=1 Tax=Microbispora oryzae TaxID=2806554 RepID=A0A940WJ89_9ACTN|nr:hypothetical protein [Microbispora oryzae]MBP2702555.1 hypothetical protein [Microbispora oryzae]